MCSMSACAPSVTSRHGGRSTLQRKTESVLYMDISRCTAPGAAAFLRDLRKSYPPQSRYTRQSLQQAAYRLIYQFVTFCERNWYINRTEFARFLRYWYISSDRAVNCRRGEGVGEEGSRGERQSIKNYRQNGKCNRNYWNFCRSSHVASQIFMQVIEVYKLHSFSAQVYSFRQGRRICSENKSNICTFLSCITVNCIFLFPAAFVIIIVYKGACADPLHEDVFY